MATYNIPGGTYNDRTGTTTPSSGSSSGSDSGSDTSYFNDGVPLRNYNQEGASQGGEYVGFGGGNELSSTWNSDVQSMLSSLPVSTTVSGAQLGSQRIGTIGAGLGTNYVSSIYGNNAGLGEIDPATGLLIKKEDKDKKQPAKVKTEADYLKEAMDMYSGQPEVNSEDIRKGAERDSGLAQAQSQRDSTRSAINSITTKMNTDLLRLRAIGDREGVTEAVYGGQQAQISREATIKLLPLQAQLAIDQGNFEMAQERTNNLFKLRFEDATKKADRWMQAAKLGYENYSKAEQNKLNEINKTYSNRNSVVSDLTNFAQSTANELLKSGNKAGYNALTTMVMPDSTSPNFESELAKAKAKISQYGSQIPADTQAGAKPTHMQLSDGSDVLVDKEGNIVKVIGGPKVPESTFKKTETTLQEYRDNGYSRQEVEDEWKQANASANQDPSEVILPLTVQSALNKIYGEKPPEEAPADSGKRWYKPWTWGS